MTAFIVIHQFTDIIFICDVEITVTSPVPLTSTIAVFSTIAKYFL